MHQKISQIQAAQKEGYETVNIGNLSQKSPCWSLLLSFSAIVLHPKPPILVLKINYAINAFCNTSEVFKTSISD